MKAALIQGTLALALLSQSVENRVIIQSDNIGETMDGPGKITLNPGNTNWHYKQGKEKGQDSPV